MCTADFVNWINSDDCHRLFNIHDQYHIQVVETNSNRNGDAEMGNPIMVSFSDTIAQRFNSRNTAFYLRPVHPITEEFIRRDNYSIAPNYERPEININNSTPETPEINEQSNSDDARQIL